MHLLQNCFSCGKFKLCMQWDISSQCGMQILINWPVSSSPQFRDIVMLQYRDIAILGNTRISNCNYHTYFSTWILHKYFPATHAAKSLRRQLLKSDGTSSMLVLLYVWNTLQLDVSSMLVLLCQMALLPVPFFKQSDITMIRIMKRNSWAILAGHHPVCFPRLTTWPPACENLCWHLLRQAMLRFKGPLR